MGDIHLREGLQGDIWEGSVWGHACEVKLLDFRFCTNLWGQRSWCGYSAPQPRLEKWAFSLAQSVIQVCKQHFTGIREHHFHQKRPGTWVQSDRALRELRDKRCLWRVIELKLVWGIILSKLGPLLPTSQSPPYLSGGTERGWHIVVLAVALVKAQWGRQSWWRWAWSSWHFLGCYP